jgi:hypothetical protein
MKVSRGKEHDFLGMKISLREDRTVSIDMKSYIKEAIADFKEDITKMLPPLQHDTSLP